MQGKVKGRGRYYQAVYRAVALLVLAGLLVSWVPAQAVSPAQTTPAAGCEAVAPEALRDELNRISQTIFADTDGAVDIGAIVARQWTALGMDAHLDDAIGNLRLRAGERQAKRQRAHGQNGLFHAVSPEG